MNEKMRKKLVDMYSNEIGFSVCNEERTPENISDSVMVVELLDYLLSELKEQKQHTHSIGRGGY